MTYYITLNPAAHKARSLLPPGVRHQCSQSWIPLVDVGSRSLHVYLVCCFGSLAAAVYQAAPSHDLRRRVQHRVNLLAGQVQKVAEFLEREHTCAHWHETPRECLQTRQRKHGQTSRRPVMTYYFVLWHIITYLNIHLYRRYHSRSTKTHSIRLCAGLTWAVPCRSLWSSTVSCNRSNRRNGSNNSRWRISIPVILPSGRPSNLEASPESTRCLDAFLEVDLRSWSKMDLATAQRGSTVSCRPLNFLPSLSFRCPYTRLRRLFSLVAASPTICRRTSSSVSEQGSVFGVYGITLLRIDTYYDTLLPKKRRNIPRRTWIITPWSIWCKESRIYIWNKQKFDTSQNALKNRWYPDRLCSVS